jgi:dihydrofolate synthase/folylpolyglutamate synthase
MNDYKRAVAYLESLLLLKRDDDKRAGLARQKALLETLGNPQDSFPTVHVGGTSGKGSTAIILAEILKNSGYKTGLHISPHLEDIRERMQVNGKLMSASAFVDIVKHLKPFIEKVKREYDYGWPSYFEVLVALSFEHFKREKVDIAVVEVGMGGRYDGTNTVSPYAAILTNVGLDHTEYLGNTVEKIAGEKVGIFKKGIDVLSGVTKPSIIRIARNEAERSGCRLYLLGKEIKYKLVKYGNDYMVFDLQFSGKSFKRLALSALGEHQIRNASLSVSAALLLRKHGFNASEQTIRRTLRSISLPGRFEMVRRNPIVILDGAHNPMKMEALVSTLEHIYKNKRFKVVFAAKKGKNIKKMLDLIGRVTDVFYFTRFEATTDFGKSMSYDPAELQKNTRVPSSLFGSSAAAYKKALQEAKKGDIICVTGSLYLVGELRAKLVA